MSDSTEFDTCWERGWEDGVERGDSLERWMLNQELYDETGRAQRSRGTGHRISELADPDR